MTSFEFTEQMDQKLILCQGFLEYLAGLDPTREWDIRGIAGKHSRKLNDWQTSRREKLNQIAQQDEFLDNVQSFVDDVRPILNAFLQDDRDRIQDVVGDREFYFIVGPPRTGGTYVYTQVSEAFNWPWDRLFRTITHDGMPSGKLLRGKVHRYENMGWRKPKRYINVMFQLSCFIEYVRREVPESDAVVLKNMSLCHAVKLLDTMFGEKARYLVTVRHPAAMAASRAESRQDQVNNQQYKQGCFDTWHNMYSELLRDGEPAGTMTLLQFGEPMDQYLDELYDERGIEDRTGQVQATKREYDQEFWNRNEFQEKIDWLKDFYSLHGFEFPMPETIQ